MSKPTGQDIVDRALEDIGKRYVYGAFVPKDYPKYPGPWDCAEAASYWVYQVSKILFGTSNHTNPETADAWTGYWLADGKNPSLGQLIPVAYAASTPGAAVLRIGTTYLTGHIVISDGKGKTREAHSRARGVIEDTLSGRRWDYGILVNGIKYDYGSVAPVVVPAPGIIYYLTTPMMAGEGVRTIQSALVRHNYNPGMVDGIYGSQTFSAVLRFQRANGLIVDGEVGPLTWVKMGLGMMR